MRGALLEGMTKTSRKIHLWLSLLFAPSLIFFAISGSLMMFGLHESSSTPAWLEKLSEVHKTQSIDDRPTRAAKPTDVVNGAGAARTERVAVRDSGKPDAVSDAAPARTRTSTEPARSPLHRSLPLMLWFAALAVGLITTAVVGVYLAFAYKRDRATVWGLLAAGVVIPVILAFL